jgi:hypothetical protein
LTIILIWSYINDALKFLNTLDTTFTWIGCLVHVLGSTVHVLNHTSYMSADVAAHGPSVPSQPILSFIMIQSYILDAPVSLNTLDMGFTYSTHLVRVLGSTVYGFNCQRHISANVAPHGPSVSSQSILTIISIQLDILEAPVSVDLLDTYFTWIRHLSGVLGPTVHVSDPLCRIYEKTRFSF